MAIGTLDGNAQRLAAQRTIRPGVCFFPQRSLCAARDFSQRDQDGEHVYEIMRTFCRIGCCRQLDWRWAEPADTQPGRRFCSRVGRSVGHDGSVIGELYAEAYRLCDNYGLRKQQIDMLMEVGQGVNKLARRPFAEQVLRLAHGPAYRAGWGELQDFLERGLSHSSR